MKEYSEKYIKYILPSKPIKHCKMCGQVVKKYGQSKFCDELCRKAYYSRKLVERIKERNDKYKSLSSPQQIDIVTKYATELLKELSINVRIISKQSLIHALKNSKIIYETDDVEAVTMKGDSVVIKLKDAEVIKDE